MPRLHFLLPFYDTFADSPRPLPVFRSLRLLRDLSLPAAGVPRMRLSPRTPALPRPAFVVILSGA